MKNLRWLEFLFPFVFLIFVCCPAQTFFPTIMSRIKIGTLNLNGARDVYKRATLFQLIKINKIDVMMIQETHSDCANEIEWKKEWEGEIILSHKSTVSGGVAVLFQKNFLPISYEVENVVDGHLMIVKAQFEKLKLSKTLECLPIINYVCGSHGDASLICCFLALCSQNNGFYEDTLF